jgi:hypothetical protein
MTDHYEQQLLASQLAPLSAAPSGQSVTSSSSIYLNLLPQLLLQHQQSQWGTANSNIAAAVAALAAQFQQQQQQQQQQAMASIASALPRYLNR